MMARKSALVIRSGRGGEEAVEAAIVGIAVECDGGVTIRFDGHDSDFYLELVEGDVATLFETWRREKAELASYRRGLAAVERSASRAGG